MRFLSGIVLAFLVAGSAGAQWICSDPDNFTENCGFDAGIDGWAQLEGDLFTPDADGHYAPGSIGIDAGWSSLCAVKLSQCITDITGLHSGIAGFWIKVVSGTPAACYVNVVQYANSDCSQSVTNYGFTVATFTEEWTGVFHTFSIAFAIESVGITVTCDDAPTDDFSVLVDDIFILEGGGVPLFADGFEHGDDSRWSASSP